MQDQSEKNIPYSNGEQAILDAAASLFAEKGFAAVSMSAIARKAKTSKPNIYHHFKNKDDLYLAIMKRAVHRSTALLDALEDAPGSFGQHLTDFSAGQLKNILEHEESTQLILREALSGGSEPGREIAKHVVGNVFSRLVDMVAKGQRENEFRQNIDPTLAAFMIISANMFYFQANPVMQHIPEANFIEDVDTYSNGVMDVLFHGMLQGGEDKS
jgi:TetR/AcrR family transcriptional regulator